LFQIGRFLKIFFPETVKPIEPKLGRKHINISFVRISASNITSIFSKRSLHLISNLVFSNKLEAQWAEPA
jgi:hypothetical protein